MKYKNWSKFLISCSGIKDIMTKPRNCTDLTSSQRISYNKIIEKKSNSEEISEKEQKTLDVLQAKIDRFNDPELSVAAKKYLIKRYSWSKYNRGTLPTEQKSSFIIKGNELESDGISIVKLRDKVDYEKPTDFVSNNYLFGRCDIISKEKRKIIDIKVSWGIHSYLPNYLTKLSEKYWWQMQGYMELYGFNKAEVCYILLNTPAHLLERERAKHTEKYLFGEIDSEKYEEEMEKCDLCYDYSKIPSKRKVLTFSIKKEPIIMESVYKKIDKCRDWLNEFDRQHTLNKKILTSASDYAIFSKESIIESDSDLG